MLAITVEVGVVTSRALGLGLLVPWCSRMHQLNEIRHSCSKFPRDARAFRGFVIGRSTACCSA